MNRAPGARRRARVRVTETDTMRWHQLGTLFKWAAALALLGGLAFGLSAVHELAREESAREEASEKVPLVALTRDGTVSLEEDAAERYGLAAVPARAVSWRERVTVYGRVVPNPGATAEVRTPFAGVLRADPTTPWPSPGAWVRAGTVLGWVDVRVGPEVRLDLYNKLAEARLRQQGSDEVVRVLEGRVKSLQRVTDSELLSRGELEAAQVQLAEARTQASTARAAVELWQKAIQEIDRRPGAGESRWSLPLAAPADGDVTELAARPGLTVEAGALVLQVVDFRRPLVRLDVPPEVLAPRGPPPEIEIQGPAATLPALRGVRGATPTTTAPPAMTGRLAGPAPQINSASQFVGYWYTLSPRGQPAGDTAAAGPDRPAPPGAVWRPGLQVQADVHAAGAEPQPAVAVPATAVLYHEGRPLVYVRLGPEKYQRRGVSLLGREGDDWVVAVPRGELPDGVAAGEAVVSRQAQVLLGLEFFQGVADLD